VKVSAQEEKQRDMEEKDNLYQEVGYGRMAQNDCENPNALADIDPFDARSLACCIQRAGRRAAFLNDLLRGIQREDPCSLSDDAGHCRVVLCVEGRAYSPVSLLEGRGYRIGCSVLFEEGPSNGVWGGLSGCAVQAPVQFVERLKDQLRAKNLGALMDWINPPVIG
jgi:hypothetical protein